MEKIRNYEKRIEKATYWRVVEINAFFVMETTGWENVGLSPMYKLGTFFWKKETAVLCAWKLSVHISRNCQK